MILLSNSHVLRAWGLVPGLGYQASVGGLNFCIRKPLAL